MLSDILARQLSLLILFMNFFLNGRAVLRSRRELHSTLLGVWCWNIQWHRLSWNQWSAELFLCLPFTYTQCMHTHTCMRTCTCLHRLWNIWFWASYNYGCWVTHEPRLFNSFWHLSHSTNLADQWSLSPVKNLLPYALSILNCGFYSLSFIMHWNVRWLRLPLSNILGLVYQKAWSVEFLSWL